MKESKTRNTPSTLFTVSKPPRSAAVRKLKISTGEYGNKLTTLGLYAGNTVAVKACGHDWVEQCFKQKGPVIDSQPNRFKILCVGISNRESGEVYRNITVIKFKATRCYWTQ